MSLTAKQSGKAYSPAPQGTFAARCVQVIDLGHQYSKYYEKTSHKVLIGWEIPEETNDEGEPVLIWLRYTLSLHQNSAIRKDLESWRNKPFSAAELEGFDLGTILGVPCMINITHRESDGATYADVSGVMSLPKGINVPAQHHDSIVFDIEDWSDSVFDTFSDNLKETIMDSTEMKARNNQNSDQQMNEADPDDDIPFAWLLPFGLTLLSSGLIA